MVLALFLHPWQALISSFNRLEYLYNGVVKIFLTLLLHATSFCIEDF